MTNLSVEERIELIKSIGEEIVGLEELKPLLESNEDLITYDGFEPSGQMHIAQGIQRAVNVNKMVRAGFKFKMLVADWFGYLNNKMGGDIEKIQIVGKYFIELWRASGMDLDGVEFIWTSDMIKDPKYWELVLKVGKSNSLRRVLKTTQIMGRKESDDLTAAQIFYPCMQVADIFTLGAQLTELGMDQRKANMLARDSADELGFRKPIVVSHHMLRGLGVARKSEVKYEEIDRVQIESATFTSNIRILHAFDYQIKILKTPMISNSGIDLEVTNANGDIQNLYLTPENSVGKVLGLEISFEDIDNNKTRLLFTNLINEAIDSKMSKSIPDSAIFMTDSEEDVKRKITKAYCMDGVVEDNPILEYCKYLIFESVYLKGQENLLSNGFIVERPEKWGGNIVFKDYQELEDAFAKKELSSIDLKSAVIKYINQLLQPVRDHFENDANAKSILEQVKSFQVTR